MNKFGINRNLKQNKAHLAYLSRVIMAVKDALVSEYKSGNFSNTSV